MGMFQDWVEKKVDEVQRLSDRELAGSNLRPDFKMNMGMGVEQDPYGGTQQITQGGGVPDPENDRWFRDGPDAERQSIALGGRDPSDIPDEAPPEAPAPEPFSQARRKAVQAAQKRKPSSQEGQEMARGIRMMNPQNRGQINMVNDKLKGADLSTLRRINAAIDRIIGPEAVLGRPEEVT